MPFARVKPAGYGVGAYIAHDELTQLDEDHSKAPNWTDGDQLNPSAPVEQIGGIFRFKTAGELAAGAGGVISIESGGTLSVEASGGIQVAVGAVIQLDGVQTVDGTVAVNGDLNVNSGGEIQVLASGKIELQASSTLELQSTIVPTYDSARTFTRTASHVANFDGASWSETVVPNVGYYTSNSVAATSFDVITFAIDPPDGCTITGVSVWTDPPAGHGGVDPINKTTLKLYEQNVATGAAVTTIFTLIDPDTVAGTYESAHAITKTGLSVAVDKSTKTYFVVIIPENGGSAQTGTKIWPPRFTFTRGKLGEE